MSILPFDLYKYYQVIKKENIIFSYSGPISQATVEGIGQTLRQDLETEDADYSLSQKMFSIFVEQMQNILSYSAEKVKESEKLEKELRVGAIVIGHTDNAFYVYCGNKVLNKDVGKLKEKIEVIRMLDMDDLKALYKEKRRQATENESKGAGLGLIDMARKSGKPIEYDFMPIDDEFTFFSMNVMVGRQ